MIKDAQKMGIGVLCGLFIWGMLMDFACYFNLEWAFWLLILVLVIGVVWAMIHWPWPRIDRVAKARE